MKPRLELILPLLVLLFVIFWLWPRNARKSPEETRAEKFPAAASKVAATSPGSPLKLAAPPASGSNPPAAIPAASSPSGAQAAGARLPAGEGQISAAAMRQIASLEKAKAGRTPVQEKIDSQLLYADKMRRGELIAEGVPTQRVDLDQDGHGRVLVDIKADVTQPLLEYIGGSGGNVVNSFPQYRSIRAGVPLAEIENVAARPDVVFVQAAVRARHNNVDSEGDTTHQANTARATLGANGAGVKVGVLSDSVDYLTNSQIAGLVTVVPGQSGMPGTGEGTAMLEIVNDLAPGAQLFFATGNDGESVMASNILSLRFTYGCNVIVDDVTYDNESPFQDGIIAQAVDAVTASGGMYFSSAANSGNLDNGTSGTWEGDFVNGGPAGSPVNGKGGSVHDFGGATNYDIVAQASSDGGGTVLLWSDPLGASTNDYDLYILDSTGTSVISSSTTTQNGFQDPFEYVPAPAAGELIVVVLASGTGRFLHIDTERGVLGVGTQGSTRGHNAATNGFSVAATAANNSYPDPFAGGGVNPVETFSSDGPRRMFYWPDGTPFTPGNFSSTGGAVFQKPDITAADGVTTDVPGFAPFYGTSAAAPHAAAIAALLDSYGTNLTPTQIRMILTNTALDIMAPGVDRDSGAGIVMALAALQAAPLDALWITGGAFNASGPIGGPFSQSAQNFSLTNGGSGALTWSLVNTSSWLTASADGGILTPGGPAANLTVSLNAVASNLDVGAYSATVLFTDQTSQFAQTRQFTLTVQPLELVQNGGFETGDFSGWSQSGNSAGAFFLTTSPLYVHSGVYGAVMGPLGSLGYLSQMLPTSAGRPYLLSFWLNNIDFGNGVVPNEFLVSWNGNTLFDQINLPVMDWTNMQFIVSATEASTLLEFGFQNDPAYFGFDDVSVAPVPVPWFQGVTQGNGTVTFTWNTMSGLGYQVQYLTDVSQTNWNNLGSPTNATGATVTMSDTIGPDPQRFYRVVLLP